MRKLAAAMIISSLAGFASAADLPKDAFLRDEALKSAASDNIERLAHDVTMGRSDASKRLEDWLAQHKDAAAPADLKLGWSTLCNEYARRLRYAAARDACAASSGKPAADAAPNTTVGLMRVLADEQPVSWDRPGIRADLKDFHVTIHHGAESVEAMVDTGAEIAVVMESVAKRLGGRALKGNVSIGSSTTPVAGGIVIFDELEIGGAKLRHLPALVLSDEKLTIPNGPTLRFIFSLPAMTAAGRIAFQDHGKFIAFGAAAEEVTGESTAPLYWDDYGVGFAADFATQRRGVHFDTGSNATWLFPTVEPALSDTERKSRKTIDRRFGGVGGERIEHATQFSDVAIGVAGLTWRLPSIEMMEKDDHGEAARIGTDFVSKFRTVTLDFKTMRLRLRQ